MADSRALGAENVVEVDIRRPRCRLAVYEANLQQLTKQWIAGNRRVREACAQEATLV